VKNGETVAIVGSGPIGLMALQSARIQGAGQVIVFGHNVKRQRLALESGATAVIDPSRQDPVAAIGEHTDGAGADVVIECAGSETSGIMAGRIARRKGRVVILGVFEQPAKFDFTDLVFGEKNMMGSMGPYGVMDEVIQVMAEGKFDGSRLITAKIGLDEIVSGGFESLIKHKEENVKILVSPT
jgi:(R,R)-butanediol dehydrogenase/meso-butanediol dehydrogenase/diacetyl reductase